MQQKSFFDSLQTASDNHESLLCVGLDPSLDIPAAEVLPRMKAIVDATQAASCLYKPNIAFYEARGARGWETLAELIVHIHSRGFPVLLDAKRGDIASTADAYAAACFDALGADAVTVNPLLGGDSVARFTARADRGCFLLCHTSNPGARDIQELDAGGSPLYERIASLALGWTQGNIALVVGATYPRMLERVRAIVPDMWVLLPGIGAQGGDLEASLSVGLDARGSGVLVNVSRGISGAADPGAAAMEYRDRINAIRRARRGAGGTASGAHGGVGAGQPAGAAPAVDPSHTRLTDQIALGLHALGAVRLGEFTLKSGQKSPIYIDLRLLVSDPALMSLVGSAMAAKLAGLSFDRIAAIPYGGLPIGQAAALASGRPLIYPRREVKEYGTKKLIEGKYEKGETAVILDDLITTGGSKLEAIAPLEEAGMKVRDIVVLVDREQGGARELAERGLALHAVLTLSELLDALVRNGRIEESVRTDVRAALGIR